MINKLKFQWRQKLISANKHNKIDYKLIIKEANIFGEWLEERINEKDTNKWEKFCELEMEVISEYNNFRDNGIIPSTKNYDKLAKLFINLYKDYWEFRKDW